MRSRLIYVFAAALTALVTAGAVSASDGGDRGREHAVFVQTNELDGNKIVVFQRHGDGRLTEEDTYPTGGNGGNVAPGTASDRLGSQGSLVYDERHRLLFAVNAGSDSVSVFRVNGTRLRLTDVDPSGGDFPASIAVHDDLVYVLNAGGVGIVQGFEIRGDRIRALEGSARSLGLANTDPPNFLTSPGQVGFTPDGSKLIVTTKASGSTIDIFSVRRDGTLSETAVENPSATPVPFAFTFDPRGRLVSGEAAMSTVTTYTINTNRTLANPQSQSDNQVALCWIVEARGFFYVANTGQQQPQRLPDRRQRTADADRPDGRRRHDRRGADRHGLRGRRQVPLLPDGPCRNRRGVPRRRRRDARAARQRRRPAGRAGRHRGELTQVAGGPQRPLRPSGTC